MSLSDINRNSHLGGELDFDKPHDRPASEMQAGYPSVETYSGDGNEGQPAVPTEIATRSGAGAAEGISKGKLILLGGGLIVAVLFFVFTALVGKSSKKPASIKPAAQQAKLAAPDQPKGSVTPVMDSVHPPATDDSSGQLDPNDIRRTRSSEPSASVQGSSNLIQNAGAGAGSAPGSLGTVPSFADTQQHWQEPQPYGAEPADGSTSNLAQETQDRNSLKEPSLVFVRSQVQSATGTASKTDVAAGDAPFLQITPGTRVQAKLQTQISSAVQVPVVAVVEYTYAIGDRVVVPAGARVYGQLQQADRSGLVSVKFDEIELIDGKREKIDAIGAGLDLGPIKGDVYGKNTGRNFVVRAVSGIGSVLAEVAGNNSGAAFSEDDMLRERLAENIGTAGDSEVMNLNANSRIVVSVPADTKIYVIFTKHEQGNPELRRAASTSP